MKWERAWALTHGAAEETVGRFIDESYSGPARDARRRELREIETVQETLLTLIRFNRDESGHALVAEIDEDSVEAFIKAMPRLLQVISSLLVALESIRRARSTRLTQP